MSEHLRTVKVKKRRGVCVYVHVWVWISVGTSMCVCLHECVCLCVHVWVWMRVCACMHTHMCMCMDVWMYGHMYLGMQIVAQNLRIETRHQLDKEIVCRQKLLCLRKIKKLERYQWAPEWAPGLKLMDTEIWHQRDATSRGDVRWRWERIFWEEWGTI